MQRGLTAEIAAADADPSASQTAPVAPRRWRLVWMGLALLAGYLIALVAMLPARFVFHPDTRWALAGTVWNGEAVLDGAYRVEWRWAPWRSLAALGFAADWRLGGSGADIAGSAVRHNGRLLIEGATGQANGALLAALAPGLPFACDAPLTVDVPRLLIAGSASYAEGEVRSEAGSCAFPQSLQSVPIPALTARATRDRAGVSTAIVSPSAQPRLRLVTGVLAGGHLTMASTRIGGDALPFLRNWRIDRAL